MAKQPSPSKPPAMYLSHPRQSDRLRTATARFVDGGNAAYLPRLSFALGVNVIHPDHADAGVSEEFFECDAPFSLTDTVTADDCAQAPDPVPWTTQEKPDQNVYTTETQPPRRSARARKPTARFLDGGSAAFLPSLSLALGVGCAVVCNRDDVDEAAGTKYANGGGAPLLLVGTETSGDGARAPLDTMLLPQGKPEINISVIPPRRSERVREASTCFIRECW